MIYRFTCDDPAGIFCQVYLENSDFECYEVEKIDKSAFDE
jgi:hypothetical protein